jgi:hypothetical protein
MINPFTIKLQGDEKGTFYFSLWPQNPRFPPHHLSAPRAYDPSLGYWMFLCTFTPSHPSHSSRPTRYPPPVTGFGSITYEWLSRVDNSSINITPFRAETYNLGQNRLCRSTIKALNLKPCQHKRYRFPPPENTAKSATFPAQILYPAQPLL